MKLSLFSLAATLTTIFAAARAFGFNDWSWLWVFSPLLVLGGAVVVITIAAGIVIVAADFVIR
jgi:hypothetical protein